MSYKVKKHNNLYCVVENDDLVVNQYPTRVEANKVCRGLNLGKGFNGYTPRFVSFGSFSE